MQNLFAPLLKIILSITERLTGKKKPPAPACQFCGAPNHDSEHCPNAAKYKLFHVDRE
jgi:hypothetical protein